MSQQAQAPVYVTVKSVSPEQVRCAVAGCKRDGEASNLVEAELKQLPLLVRLFLCDGCYSAYRQDERLLKIQPS